MRNCLPSLFLLALLGLSATALALEPHEVLVLANSRASNSVDLAKYYMEKRGIPENNLLKIRMTDKERCSRNEYEEEVIPVIREYLRKNDLTRTIRCMVAMYGLPLKIDPSELNRDDKKLVEQLRESRIKIQESLRGLPKEQLDKRGEFNRELESLGQQLEDASKHNQRSSFDSELALVLVDDYPLKGWILNPFFGASKEEQLTVPRGRVLMVSRLDGPDPATVRRIIDDSINAEKTGLKGRAYFDAKLPRPDGNKNRKAPDNWYDLSLHKAAEIVEKSGRMPVTVNSRRELFQTGDCPKAALYSGWYSLGKYVDAFTWQPGAVGYHIASSECGTLRAGKSQVWCKVMLEKGAAATLGPVGEPYLQAFPPPEMFFGLLVDGRMTLAECYILSLPWLSWQMVLVGDPLYRPFKNAEVLKD